MDANLKFIKTLTVEQFKANQGVNELRVKINPKTGKQFLAWIGGTGAIGGGDVRNIENPVISLVRTEDDVEFWMLHREGDAGETVATF